MAAIQSRKLLQVSWLPHFQSLRFRKVNIQKPFPPHHTRAVVEEVCKPLVARSPLYDPDLPKHLTCDKATGFKYFKKDEKENHFLNLLCKNVFETLNQAKLIAFFHRNQLCASEIFDMRVMLKKHNMKLNIYGKSVMQRAFQGTRFQETLCLFDTHCAVVWCDAPSLDKLIKCLKKMHNLSLMAAVVEDRFLSRAECEEYARLPDLQTMRSQLVCTLNMTSQHVIQHLNHHQTTLARHLEQLTQEQK